MNRIQSKFVSDAMDYEERLSEWELQFINDLADKPDDYELSDKQNSPLRFDKA